MTQTIHLDDKYDSTSGRIFISGTQALVRLLIAQKRRDRTAGLNTAGFVSGYRGSPLGNVDDALWRAHAKLAAHDVHFQPGVNEDLAATSCWGSQQAMVLPKPNRDGVFALWYGKGPGVDRSGDALKHGNFAGASAQGGVLVVAGDDHGAKSSTTAHQSDQALAAAMIPVLAPACVQDILDFGLQGWALSRFSGLWAGLKCVTDVVETTAVVDVDGEARRFSLPEVEKPAGGLNIRLSFRPREEEIIVTRYRLPAALAFARANPFDRIVFAGRPGGITLAAVGKAYADTRRALDILGLDARRAPALGVTLYKVGLVWPLEADGLVSAARDQKELFVVEEKRALVEEQAARALYNMPAPARPNLSGKKSPEGSPLLPADGEFTPITIALAVFSRLQALELDDAPLREAARLLVEHSAAAKPDAPSIVRAPAFCSGCPHNTSTRLPEGALALAGIGCHTMAHYMPDRPTAPPTQMGGEGANWIGAAPFTDMAHVFQNLGDGTYFHSGLIAVRAAVAAKVNITYKILYNDAVAMTGGQPIDGQLSVADVVAQLRAEGVSPIVVVSDAPHRHRALRKLAEVRHRDDLIAVEENLQRTHGVSALVYEQTCAAEKRRRRKKGQFPDPPKRYFINDLVCEGCGDCSVKSNCVSIQPLETALGRKRVIDQSSCNKDYSCAKGFCPSFITVEGGRLRKPAQDNFGALDAAGAGLPDPTLAPIHGAYSIYVAGIGGTGVVTIGAVLGMAAHMGGLACSILDVTGLSQKNGAVASHVQIAARAEDLAGARIGAGQCDVLIGCDSVVSAAPETLAAIAADRTTGLLNTHLTPTAAFQFSPNMNFQQSRFERTVRSALREAHALDATDISLKVFGDSIGANMLMVGFAAQSGLLPVAPYAIEQAIALNGVAVEMNRRAFRLGRLIKADPERARVFYAASTLDEPIAPSLTDLISQRENFLGDYQDAAYARAYRGFVEQVIARERETTGGQDVSFAVARTLFKLMAYKDEYEVARLHGAQSARARLNETFEGKLRLSYNLAPPLFSPRDRRTGEPLKISIPAVFLDGPFLALRAMRRLRGTPFDLFGYTRERREERGLITHYRLLIEGLMEDLSSDNAALAVELSNLPEQIRGYGHVKARAILEVQKRQTELLDEWRALKRERAAA